MAAINFPDSPSNGTTHTVGGTTWTYNSTLGVWEITSSVSTATSIDDLTDVDITTVAPTANQTLLWNAATSNFVPGTITGYSNADVTAHLASFDGSIIPAANVTYDLGSATNRFRDLYISGNSINLGDVQLSANNGGLAVTSNSGGGSTASFATQDYVTTQITNLVDSAPGALDTLNELAAALGDDANFATTVTNQIAAKANTADLATVATSGSYADLTNQPTLFDGQYSSLTGAPTIPNEALVVEYVSTTSASINDVVMLNANNTVTPIIPTNYPFVSDKGTANMTAGGYDNNAVSGDAVVTYGTATVDKFFGIWVEGNIWRGSFHTNSSGSYSFGTEYNFSSYYDGTIDLDPARGSEPYVLNSTVNTDRILLIGTSSSGQGNRIVSLQGTISGTAITWDGNLVTHPSYGTNSGDEGYSSAGHFITYDYAGSTSSVDKLIMEYSDVDGNRKLIRIEWDGTTLTYGTPVSVTGKSGFAFDAVTEGRFVARSGTTDIIGGLVTWSSSTVTFGGAFFVNSSLGNMKLGIDPLSGKIAGAWNISSSPWGSYLTQYSMDGTYSITSVGGFLWDSVSSSWSSRPDFLKFAKNSSSFIVSYLDKDSSYYGQYRTWSVDGTSFATVQGASNLPYRHSGSTFGTTANLQDNPHHSGQIAMAYEEFQIIGGVDKYYYRTKHTQLAYSESNINVPTIHGVAASAGTTINVTLENGIHTSFSNLSVGSKYFVLENGTISTSADANQAKLGEAISNTHLALDFTDEASSSSLSIYPLASSLSTVATSGSYTDLSNKPALANVATSGSYTDLTGAPAGLSIHANQAAMLTDAASATEGTLHYETDNNRLYVKMSAGFFLLASITNVSPTINSFSENTGGAGANDLTTGGTFALTAGNNTVITINASDDNLDTLTYSATVTSGTSTDVFSSPSFPVSNQSGNTFTLTPVTSGSGGTVTIRFDVSDGTNVSNVIHSFSISFASWSNASQQAKLVGSDTVAGDYAGWSTYMSGDGNYAIVGARLHDSPTQYAGAAYVYIRSGTSWSQQAKLQNSDTATHTFFGENVALDSDGDTAIIGASSEDTTYSDSGAAYVFVRSGTTWSQQAKLKPSDLSASDQFGYKVAISDDGNTVAFGVPYSDATYTDAGAVYVFTRSGTSWSQQQKIQSSDIAAGDNFGFDVALSGDGDTLLVGAHNDDSTYTDQGAAYVFTRSGSTWSQQAKLTASDAAQSDRFGVACDLNQDGNYAIISSSNNVTVYIFTRSGSTWSQQQAIANPDSTSNNFGYDVSINSAADLFVTGGRTDAGSGYTNAGAAYFYSRSGTTWSQESKVYASDPAIGKFFGASVSISDGDSAIIGAYNADAGYIFVKG